MDIDTYHFFVTLVLSSTSCSYSVRQLTMRRSQAKSREEMREKWPKIALLAWLMAPNCEQRILRTGELLASNLTSVETPP